MKRMSRVPRTFLPAAPSPPRGSAAGLAILLLASAFYMRAATLNEAAHDLAAQIAAALPSHTGAVVSFENMSTLSASEAARIQGLLEAEMKQQGIVSVSGGSQLIIDISENNRGFLLLAQIALPSGTRVLICPWTMEAAPGAPEVAQIALFKNLVIAQPAPVLDFLLPSPSQLIVLEPGRAVNYSLTGTRWTIDRFTEVTLERPLPRDARGRLIYANGLAEIHLADRSAMWPLADQTVRWVAGRNYLTGSDASQFFATAFSNNRNAKAELDGRVHIYDATGNPLAVVDSWGSDLAAITGSCGRSFVIASSNSDRDQPDRLQAYDLNDQGAVAIGDPLTFPGRITTLWPSETGGQLSVVAHNPGTGQYEAYRVALTCTQ
jgi:hypothetical protein